MITETMYKIQHFETEKTFKNGYLDRSVKIPGKVEWLNREKLDTIPNDKCIILDKKKVVI